MPVSPAKFPGYNREAEQLNAYIKAYVALNDHVVLIDVYNGMRNDIDQKWKEYYETPSLLHPNRKKSHPNLNNLVIVAVDFWMQDKQEVLCSSRLNTSEQSDDYFRVTSISDPHNDFRRKLERLRQRGEVYFAELRPQINLETTRKRKPCQRRGTRV